MISKPEKDFYTYKCQIPNLISLEKLQQSEQSYNNNMFFDKVAPHESGSNSFQFLICHSVSRLVLK